MSKPQSRWWPGAFQLLWMLLLLAVPVTSFPWIAERFADAAVSPLSILPLAVLIPVFLVPDFLRSGKFPFVVWPILGFLLATAVAAGVGFWLPIEPIKGQTVVSRELRASITLFVGLAFYFVTIRLAAKGGRLRWTLWGIYIGGILALIWATVQADYVIRGLNNVPTHLNQMHRWLSVRDLERNRVTGLAFEPSWLADQLVVLYLPLWLSAILTGRSILPFRRGPLSIELGLLGWGAWILLMTRSRVGIAAFLGTAGLTSMWLAWRGMGWLSERITSGKKDGPPPVVRLGARVLVLLLIVGLLVGAGYALVKKGAEVDYRLRRVLRIRTELPGIKQRYPFDTYYEVANQFAFAERLVYWRASLHAFEVAPLTGVGPGNTGFFFAEGMPAYGYHLVETRSYLDPASPNFPNPKNLWVRLLSESGMLGTAFYLTWLVLLAWASFRMRQLGSWYPMWIGTFGILSLLAQVVEGFSLDSYALPQIWIANGLLTACLLLQEDGK